MLVHRSMEGRGKATPYSQMLPRFLIFIKIDDAPVRKPKTSPGAIGWKSVFRWDG